MPAPVAADFPLAELLAGDSILADRFQSFEDFYDWLEQIAGERFNRRIVFEHGNWTALYDALADAQNAIDDSSAAVSVPAWALEASICRALPLAMSTLNVRRRAPRRGRPKTTWSAAVWRRDMIDWHRYCDVWFRRIARREDSPDHAAPAKQRAARIAFHRAAEAARRPYSLVATHIPYPWVASQPHDMDVFEAVSAEYKGSIYGGAPSRIRKSWERVTNALKKGEAWRYYESKYLRYDKHQSLTADMDRAS